ncbi:MAG TPA: hypothetical protein PLW94_03740 [Candidatus Absconditabacterales bacterium]|nr:hypothetical protein [Candidatus Absconditabacterales bacterium]
MLPFFELLGLKMYMTGIGIIVFLLSFIIVARYLCTKRHQDFYKIFYWLPLAIAIIYLCGSYAHFFLNYGLIPNSLEQVKLLFSPYGYHFHFTGLVIGFVISLVIFFKKIQRYENKRIWIDIMFFSTVLSMIPLGIFLVFGDNFIGKVSTSWIAIKPLTTQTELNKFGSVYPIGLFLSFLAIIDVVIILISKRKKKKFGQGLLGFIYFIIGLNIIFLFQQYPKYGVISLGGITFDIKSYISFFAIMFCLQLYYKRNQKPNNIV